MNIKTIFSALTLGTVILFSGHIHADSSVTGLEQLITEIAEKPEHHRALASYYREKSTEAKQSLEDHQRMRNAYVQVHQKNPKTLQGMRNHCDRLIKLYSSAVTEYEEMAALHEKEAKQN